MKKTTRIAAVLLALGLFFVAAAPADVYVHEYQYCTIKANGNLAYCWVENYTNNDDDGFVGGYYVDFDIEFRLYYDEWWGFFPYDATQGYYTDAYFAITVY